MKKILVTSVLIIAGSLIGFAQSVDKALHNGKWYANADLGSKNITLTKTAPASYVFDMIMLNETSMMYGKRAATDLKSNTGESIKAGYYYTESGYGYKITGNTFWVRYEPQEWTYNVTPQKNGDLLLELTIPSNKSTK
jgi:hypothetical protein